MFLKKGRHTLEWFRFESRLKFFSLKKTLASKVFLPKKLEPRIEFFEFEVLVFFSKKLKPRKTKTSNSCSEMLDFLSSVQPTLKKL